LAAKPHCYRDSRRDQRHQGSVEPCLRWNAFQAKLPRARYMDNDGIFVWRKPPRFYGPHRVRWCYWHWWSQSIEART